MSLIEELFKRNTAIENYRTILEFILYQINTDTSDYWSRDYIHNNTYIIYFLEHIDDKYKNKIFKIISYETLKNKVLDVKYGFGVNHDNDDRCLYYQINNKIQEELSATYDSGCMYCGCSAEKDDVGDRICYCDSCSLSGCTYVD